MSAILKNKYYLYSINEIVGGIIDIRGEKKSPHISLMPENDFYCFFADICGKKEEFYIKKDSLKRYELQAIWNETFCNYRMNGHCYVRPEMAVKWGDIVVDAGGCEGYYTRYALNMGASKVITFEPCEELSEGLKKTFANEIHEGRVVIMEKALGKRRHKEMLHINKNMICASSVIEDVEYNLKYEVSVVSLDEALKSMGIHHIDIIKMDIEGAEIDAVLGAKETIRHCHPKMIIATYHAYENAIRIRNLCEKLYKKYRCRTYGCYQFEKPYRPYMTFLH